MPRPPSIHLRLARLTVKALGRIEVKFNKDAEYEPSLDDCRKLELLAKADKLMRDRQPSDEEMEDLEATEKREEEKVKTADEVVRSLTLAVRSGTAAQAMQPTEREEEKG